MADTHLQVNPDGTTTTRKTVLWSSSKNDQELILKSIFERDNWRVSSIENQSGSLWKITTICSEKTYRINLYISSIRDELRQPDEFKMQLGTTYPEGEEFGWTTLVLGIYTIDDGVNRQQYILSGYDWRRYDFSGNPSIRGTRTFGLQKAKLFGMFKTDKSILFRPDFIYYYIEYSDFLFGNGKEENSIIHEGEIDYISRQVIYYGAPGTGKSKNVQRRTKDAEKNERVFRTTFHPDSDYSTFVGCYKPTTIMKPVRNVAGDIVKSNGEGVYEESITYQFVPQAFVLAYLKAWNTTEPVYLVIEEINRGNCAQIFGDLFQLLDRGDDKRSEYPIKADSDLERYIANNIGNNREKIPEEIRSGKKLMLPENLYILATMNTSDQSLFPIDSAFKRRWDWKYIPIENAGKNWRIKVNNNEYDWYQFLEAVNKEVFTLTHSEDKQLGYFFAKAQNNVIDAETLVDKVYFYLWTDVFKDYEYESQKAFRKPNSTEAISFKDFFAGGKIDETMAEQVLINLELKPIAAIE